MIGGGDVHGGARFDLNRDRGMRLVIDLGRIPDDQGRRADIDHALRILSANNMIEWMEWDRNSRLSSV
jgi:hypothetical protein